MLPRAGHNLPLEHPELFAATVLAFIAGVELAANTTDRPPS